jgi:hypothetical protein
MNKGEFTIRAKLTKQYGDSDYKHWLEVAIFSDEDWDDALEKDVCLEQYNLAYDINTVAVPGSGLWSPE